MSGYARFIERGTMDKATAFKKLTSQAWKMYRKDHDTNKVVEAGVQVLVQHDEWAEIIKALLDGGESGIESG